MKTVQKTLEYLRKYHFEYQHSCLTVKNTESSHYSKPVILTKPIDSDTIKALEINLESRAAV